MELVEDDVGFDDIDALAMKGGSMMQVSTNSVEASVTASLTKTDTEARDDDASSAVRTHSAMQVGRDASKAVSMELVEDDIGFDDVDALAMKGGSMMQVSKSPDESAVVASLTSTHTEISSDESSASIKTHSAMQVGRDSTKAFSMELVEDDVGLDDIDALAMKGGSMMQVSRGSGQPSASSSLIKSDTEISSDDSSSIKSQSAMQLGKDSSRAFSMNLVEDDVGLDDIDVAAMKGGSMMQVSRSPGQLSASPSLIESDTETSSDDSSSIKSQSTMQLGKDSSMTFSMNLVEDHVGLDDIDAVAMKGGSMMQVSRGSGQLSASSSLSKSDTETSNDGASPVKTQSAMQLGKDSSRAFSKELVEDDVSLNDIDSLAVKGGSMMQVSSEICPLHSPGCSIQSASVDFGMNAYSVAGHSAAQVAKDSSKYYPLDLELVEDEGDGDGEEYEHLPLYGPSQ